MKISVSTGSVPTEQSPNQNTYIKLLIVAKNGKKQIKTNLVMGVPESRKLSSVYKSRTNFPSVSRVVVVENSLVIAKFPTAAKVVERIAPW